LLKCQSCGKIALPEEVLCECGGTLIFDLPPAQSELPLEQDPWEILILFPDAPKKFVSLGEPITPLALEDGHALKLDFLFPTGSFKDRGAKVLISKLKELGIKELVEDSSGNAGASIAAYCARAGISCRIFVPQGASPGKIRQIQAYGAKIEICSGSREETRREALEASKNSYYAGHGLNPYFLLGTLSFAFELFWQLRRAPDALIIPVGSGTLLLGAWYGFLALKNLHLTNSLPRLFAVQAENCPPLYSSFTGKTLPFKETIAEGVRVQNPPRLKEMTKVIGESRGKVLAISEEQILYHWRESAVNGFYIEPTSALIFAAWQQLKEELSGLVVVAPLTGTGLKSPAILSD